MSPALLAEAEDQLVRSLPSQEAGKELCTAVDGLDLIGWLVMRSVVCLVPHRSTNPPASPKPYFNGIRDPEVRLLQQSHNVLKQDGFGKVVPSRVRGV